MGALSDRVVAVTGAGNGLGLAEASEAARQGAAVVIAEFDEGAGQAAAATVEHLGSRAVFVQGDIAEAGTADRVVAAALDSFGRLDAVVNNAGITKDRTVIKMSDAEWDDVVAVHLRGHFLMTRAAVKHWRDNELRGHLVHTSSTGGLLGNFGQVNYGAAKAGIAALSTIVALEQMKYGINSNAIAPAARTRMTQAAFGESGDHSGDGFDFWSPENVAPLVAYLCSDASSHISGKLFGVQGDAIEIYQPWTSIGAVENHGARWQSDEVGPAVDSLLAEVGMQPGMDVPFKRLRYSMAAH